MHMFDLGRGRAILKRVRPAASLHHANTDCRVQLTRRPTRSCPDRHLVMAWRIDARSGRTSLLCLAVWIPTETYGRAYMEPLSVPSAVHARSAMPLAETT